MGAPFHDSFVPNCVTFNLLPFFFFFLSLLLLAVMPFLTQDIILITWMFRNMSVHSDTCIRTFIYKFSYIVIDITYKWIPIIFIVFLPSPPYQRFQVRCESEAKENKGNKVKTASNDKESLSRLSSSCYCFFLHLVIRWIQN